MIFSLVLSLAAAPLPEIKPGQLVLVGAGDIASCSNDDDEQTAKLVEGVLAKSENARAFTLGDNVYPDGTRDQFVRCYEPTWGRFRSRTLPVVGNHDYRTPHAAGFRSFFGGRFTQDGPLYYSVDVSGVGSDGKPATWHVVALDSDCDQVGCGVDSPQYKWLVDDLKKSAPTSCTVAIFHHPRFSSGPHGDAAEMAPMWGALDKAGVDLVLSGHDHTYERFPALDKDGDVVAGAGVASIVVGSGGASHYPIAFAHEHSLLHVTGEYGVLTLRLDAGGYSAAFIRTDGSVDDVHTGSCRAAPTVTPPKKDPPKTKPDPTPTPLPTPELPPTIG